MTVNKCKPRCWYYDDEDGAHGDVIVIIRVSQFSLRIVACLRNYNTTTSTSNTNTILLSNTNWRTPTSSLL